MLLIGVFFKPPRSTCERRASLWVVLQQVAIHSGATVKFRVHSRRMNRQEEHIATRTHSQLLGGRARAALRANTMTSRGDNSHHTDVTSSVANTTKCRPTHTLGPYRDTSSVQHTNPGRTVPGHYVPDPRPEHLSHPRRLVGNHAPGLRAAPFSQPADPGTEARGHPVMFSRSVFENPPFLIAVIVLCIALLAWRRVV